MNYLKLSDKQFKALSSIAFGGNTYFHLKTLESLEKRRLIIGYEKKVYGKGNTPIDRIPIIVRDYYMPISEHIKF